MKRYLWLSFIIFFHTLGAVVYKETSVVKRGSSGFRIEGDTSAVFNILVTTNVKVEVKIWMRYNSSYDTLDGYPTVNLYGLGINSTGTMSVSADTWELITVTGTPAGEGVITLTVRSYSNAAGAILYFDEIVAVYPDGYWNNFSTTTTGGGDYFIDGEPAKTLFNTETPPRMYTGSGDYFSWTSSGAPKFIYQKYYHIPNMPLNFSAVALSDSSIKWNWLDNSSDIRQEEEYRIYSSTNGLLTTVSADTTYWIETGLSPNTTYTRYVQAWNVVGSSNSVILSRCTLAKTPLAPTLQALSGSSIRVGRQDDGNPSTVEYAIKVLKSGTTYYVQENNTLGASKVWQTASTWAFPVDVTSLDGNTNYTFSLIARNYEGIEVEGPSASKATLANQPTAEPFNTVETTTYSITCHWGANGNSEGTTYRLQVSTVSNFSVILATYTTTNLSYEVTGLEANKGYYFRVCALNLEGEPTDWTNLTPTDAEYTRIESPPQITFGEITTTSIQIDLSGYTFSNLTSGSSGLLFEETGSEGSPWNSGWITNKVFTRQENSPLSAPALTPNTTYSFTVKSRNYDALENPAVGPVIKATRIEAVESLDFIVGSSSIGVKAVAVGGSFSNLDKGESGIYYAICKDTYSFGNITKSSWVWVKTTDWYYFTECPAGTPLQPDTTYYIISNSRNYDGLCNSTTTVYTKWTLAEVPAKPQVSPKADGGETKIEFTKGPDGNSDYTEYAVAVSSDNFVTYKWATASNPSTLVDTPQWQEKYLWGNPHVIEGLNPNTTYWVRIKARNRAGYETEFSASGVTVTFANVPWNVEIGSHNIQGLDKLGVTWEGDGTRYYVEWSTASDFSVIKGSSGWISNSSWTITGLDIGRKYYVRVKAKNRVGVETNWSNGGSDYWVSFLEDYGYNYTLSTYPVLVGFSEVEERKIRITWSYNGNPDTTKIKYYIEWSTAGYGGVVWYNYGWDSTDTYKAGSIQPLERDRIYYFRGKSRIGDDVVGYRESVWNNLGTKCTLIEAPGAITTTNIQPNQITLNTSFEYSGDKIGSGSDEPGGDGVRFWCIDSGVTEDSGWIDSLSWQTSNNLSKNTTYHFRVKARNSEGIESINPSTYTVCTAIEVVNDVEVLSIKVTTITIRLRWDPGSGGETFSNLTSSSSAIRIKVFDSASYSFGDSGAKYDSGWKQDNNFVEVTGLKANTTYYIYGNSRNQLAQENTAYGPKIVVTECNIPGAPTLDYETTNQIRITLTGTTSGSEYAISVSSINQSGVYYEQADGTIGNQEVWRTEAEWGWDANGYNTLVGLTPNTSYYVWVKARNYAGSETQFGPNSVKWTKIRNAKEIQALEITTGTIKVEVLSDRNDGIFENLGEGQSHIRVSTSTNPSWYDAGEYYIISSTQVFEFSGLRPNKKYTIKAKAYNGAGVESSGEPETTVATRIEVSTYVVIGNVTEDSIEVRAGGVFTNLDLEQSGWSVYCVEKSTESGFYQDYVFHTFTGLEPNTTYHFKARTRNQDGLLNNWSIEYATVTRAKAVQVAPSLVVIDTGSINVTFSDPGNPSYTEYCIMVSSDNWVTAKYVKGDGTPGNTKVWKTRSEWGGDSGIDVKGLLPNTLYRFKVIARNESGIETLPSPEASKYTLIENPEGLNFEVYVTSVRVSAVGKISNLDEGNSGIYFKNLTTGQISNSPAGWQQMTYWINDSLLANSTYSWTVKTRNGDGVDNGFIVSQITSTCIEPPSGITVVSVSNNSISVKPSNVSSLTNLNVGLSGWKIKVDDGINVTESSWQNTEVAISTSGLKPNQEYTFYARTRNRYGYDPVGWGVMTTTYTYCNIPSSPTVEAVAGYSDRLRIKITTVTINGNPSITEYMVEIHNHDLNPNWETNTKYIYQAGDGKYYMTDYVSSATWKTRSGWGGDSGFIVLGLESNTNYAVRVVARNYYGIQTQPGEDVIAMTLPSKPANLVAEPESGYETTRIRISWQSDGSEFWVQYATSSSGIWKDLYKWNLTETTTVHYDLGPDTHTYYRVKARNTDLEETEWSDVVSTYTWANIPGAGVLSNPTTYSLLLDWGENGNPSTVEYYAEISIDSTTWSSVAGSSGWISTSSATISGLSANTKYFFRVKARNRAKVETEWKEANTEGKYTKIESPSGIEWIWIGISSISLRGSGSITNLSKDNSGIEFKNLTTGTSSLWIQTNQWICGGLSPNATYQFSIRTRNGDGLANDWITGITTATRIQNVEGLEFMVYTGSIGVRAQGTYSNLTVGSSGLRYYEVETSSYSEWRQDQSYWYLEGLEPAKKYTFKGKSRNRYGLENDWSIGFTTATLARSPLSSSPVEVTSNTITAAWSENGNVEANYEVQWSTAVDYSVYNSSKGITGNTYKIYGLTPNTTYYMRVRAYNPYGIETEWEELPATLTKIEEPGGMNFVVYTNSITVEATGTYTNLSLGESGIKFWNLTNNTTSSWQKVLIWNSTGLQPARTYTFKLRARNQAGIESGEITESTSTLAVVPGVNELVVLGTGTIKAQWTTNGNYSAEYLVEVSTIGFGSKKLGDSGWITGVNYTFNGLEANKKYYVRVKARNPDGIETNYTNLGSSYTKVENPAGLSFVAGITSITVQAVGTISNLGDGVSGILFQKAEDDSFLTELSSTSWLITISTTFTGLSPNVTYFFRAKTRNGDGVENDFIDPVSKVTLCEKPGKVTVSNITGTSMDITINGGNNSSGTEYAIKVIEVEGATYYVQTDGGLGSNETWQTIAGWGSPFTVKSLNGNTQYSFMVKAKNYEGIETEYGLAVTSSTLADIPGQPLLTVISTAVIRCVIDEGTNSSGTEFAIAVSSDNWQTVKYVQADGSLGENEVWKTKEGWGGTVGIDVYCNQANKKFSFKVKARNKDGIETDFSLENSKYTKIETPDGIDFEVYFTSMRVTALGSFSYNVGDSWIQFRIGSNVSDWQMENNYVWTGLEENTTYQFYVRTRNSDGSIVNDWVGPVTKASRIEEVTLLEFNVGVSSIGVRVGNTLSNITSGNSGVWYGVYTNSNYTGVVASTWTKSTDYFWVTGLSTNTVYYFKANSRNYDGLLNSSATFGGKYTRAVIPDIPVIEVPLTGSDKLSVSVTNGDNPSGTELAIAVSTDNFNQDIRYIYYDVDLAEHRLRDTEDWYDWEAKGSFSLVGLSPNTTYYFKVKARNGDGIETGFGEVGSRATRTTVPENVNAVGISSSTIEISWTGNGAEYFVWWSTASDGIYYSLTSDWIVETSTRHSGLQPNTKRWYKVQARNWEGLETSSSTPVYGYTQSIKPKAADPLFTGVTKSTIVVHWEANGNEAGTLYQAVIATNSAFAPALSTTTWQEDVFISTFTGLSSNTSYWFRVRAKGNYAEAEPSNWEILGSTWTLIEEVTGADWEIATSSIGVRALGTFNNLKEANSGIRYYCYSDSGFSILVASSSWLKNENYWWVEGLNTNTTYYFRLVSRNGSGIEANPLNISTATAIEAVSGLEFRVYISSIGIKAAGSYSNLDEGESGIKYWEVNTSSYSLWRKTTEWWYITGLTPGGEYRFRAKTRNLRGVENQWSIEFITYTICNIPGIPAIDLVSGSEDSSIKVVINRNGNADIVEYTIAVSSDNWLSTYYVGTSSSLITQEYWKSYDGWGGINGVEVKDLQSNTVWSFRVKARNKNCIETDFSEEVSTATYIEKPSGVEFEVIGATYVKVRAAGSFTNLGQGESGIYIWSVNASTDSGWKKENSFHEFSGLTPNYLYDWKIKARNIYGNETDYVEVSSYTLAMPPTGKRLSNITTGSIKIEWHSNGNFTGTEYFVECSTDGNFNILYSSSGWSSFSDLNEYTFTCLEANKKYYFRVKARNNEGKETGYGVVGSSYTLIEKVTDLTWSIGISSIVVEAIPENGEFSNLGDGISGLRFYCYGDSVYSELISSTSWIVSISTEFPGLQANTTYYFKVVSRNGDGVERVAYKEGVATRIEEVLGLKFIVSENAINVAPTNNFTGLNEGGSGIKYYEISLSTDSGWRRTTDYWQLTGLEPNTKYTFKAKTRNRVALENDWSNEFSTYTLCNIPLAPTLNNPTTYSINVVINENENPSYTEFAIAVSTDDWTLVTYVQAGGSLGEDEVWKTKEGWGGSINGIDIIGLKANKKYQVKVKARNVAGIESSLGPETVKYTLIESPTGITYTSLTTTSISVKALGSFSNNPGDQWIQFYEVNTAQSSPWLVNNDYTFESLSPNTVYSFKVRTQNSDSPPTVNEWVGPVDIATRIELPTGVEFDTTSLTYNSIKARSTGTLSNLTSGESGVIVYCLNLSSGVWKKDTGWVEFTGLEPNTTYYFIANSKNYFGVMNSSTSVYSIHTLCVAPSSPTVVDRGKTYIQIKISKQGENPQNPDPDTEYLIAVSTTGFISGTTYYMTSSDGPLSTTPTWGSFIYWGGNSGAKATELEKGKKYYFKVKARNMEGIETEFGEITSAWTLSDAPYLTAEAISTSSIKLTWTQTGYEYDIEYSTTNDPSYLWQELYGNDYVVMSSTIHTGINPDTKIWYRIRTRTEGGDESSWDYIDYGYPVRYGVTYAEVPKGGYVVSTGKKSITVDFSTGANPSTTQYSIYISSVGVEVSTLSYKGWDVYSNLDKSFDEFDGLTYNTEYFIWIKARNQEGVETQIHVIPSTFTLCEVPSSLQVSAVSSTELKIDTSTIDTNPVNFTKYAFKAVLYDGTTKYVQIDGTLGVSVTYYYLSEWGEIRIKNLEVNSPYWISGSAMNGNGITTDFGVQTRKYTFANVPGVSGEWQIYTTSITVNWTANGNSSETEYRVFKSTSSLGSWITDEGWVKKTSGTFTGLEANTVYWFKVQARNGDNEETDFIILGSSATRIEGIKQDTSGWEVYLSSMRITAKSVALDEEFSNLSKGLSGLAFFLYEDSNYTQLISSSNWIKSITFDAKNLEPNTSYYLAIKSRNQDGLENKVLRLGSKATKIEVPTGLKFVEVSTYSITVQPFNEFTNLGISSSAIRICNMVTGEDSGWQGSTTTWTSTGLTPAKTYSFKIKARNMEGIETEWVTGFSTSTLPNQPEKYSWSISERGVNYIKVEWGDGGNSPEAEYIVEASQEGYGGVVISSSGWLANTTYYFLNLQPNASYYIQVKARNSLGVESNYTQLGSSWTLIEPVTGINFDEVYSSSITFTAEGGPFSNLGAGLSGVTLKVYDSPFYDSLVSSTPYSTQITYTVTGLTPNTSYWFSANSRNGEGKENQPKGGIGDEIVKATRIEEVSYVEFGEITNTTIKVRPGGNYTNLDAGESGLITYCTTLGTDSGWIKTTDYWYLTGLTPNTTYTFKANSRNRVGLVNNETIEYSTMTMASKPQALPFTDVTENTITANWNSGSPQNPDGTEYQCQASSVSADGPFGWDSGWQTVVYYDFNGMSPNTKYYFRVRARNKRGVPTEWVNMGAKYTLIESPSGISVVESSTTFIRVKAIGTLSNLGSGLSGLFFEENITGKNSDWITNNEWLLTGLSPNTSYYFRVRSRNGDAVDNPPTDWIAKATEIEIVESLEFIVDSSTQISVRPSNVNNLSNLNSGLSGWNIEAYEDEGLTIFVSSTNWQKTTSYVTLSGFSPNTTYYFVGQSRNVAGSTTTKSKVAMKWTLCKEVIAPQVNVPPSSSDTDSLRITIQDDGNPSYTEYLIAVSLDKFNTTNYVQADGTLGESKVWRSKDFWHGVNGYIELNGLQSGTTYWVKVKARNIERIQTNWSTTTVRSTRSDAPVITSVYPTPGNETRQITVEWTDTGVEYFVQISTDGISWQDLGNWIAATSTSPAGLNVNRKYYFQVKAKNSEGVESSYSASKSTWTWSEVPGVPPDPVTGVFTSSMTVTWLVGNNPSYTDYKVECSTTSSFDGGEDKESSWIEANEYTFKGLKANTKYYFRARSRTEDPISPKESDWVVLNTTGKYTLIEKPTAYWVSVDITSITIKAAKNINGEDLSNLGAEGNAAVRFLKVGDVWSDWTANPVKSFKGLNPNTEYSFKIEARNGDAVSIGEMGPFAKITRIELPSGLNFVNVTTYSITAQLLDEYTNLGVSSSAVKIIQGSENSGWLTNTSSSWTKTGLLPARKYTFEVISRNQDGIENPSVFISTYTHAQVSEIQSVEGNWNENLGYYTQIIIEGKDNLIGSDGVKFAIFNIEQSKYLNPTTWELTDLTEDFDIIWSTATVWYHKNLSANTVYSYKIKTKNQSGVKTDWSGVKAGTTPVAAPTNMKHTTNQIVSDSYWLSFDCDDVADAVAYRFYISISTGGWSDTADSPTSDWTFQDLLPNTRYTCYVRASRDSIIFGAPSTSTQAYTSIQRVETAEFVIGSSSIGIRAVSNIGGFSNLFEGESGLYYEIKTSTGGVMKSTWTKVYDYIWFDGLNVNTSYYFTLNSKNGDGDLNVSTEIVKWTKASVPPPPILSDATDNSIRVRISSGTNPPWTLYQVFNNTEGKYVGMDGTLLDLPTWYTWAEFGGDEGVINTGLQPNIGYTYKVRAKNGAGIVTEWSNNSAQLNTTGVNPPGTADYSNITQTSLKANWTSNGNPSGTYYFVEISSVSDYSVVLDSSGWITSFGYEFTGLRPNTRYYCRVKAKDATSETDWTILGGVYTLIEDPTGIIWEETGEDYITIKVTGTLSNLRSGFSGLLFEEKRTDLTSDWTTNKQWTLSNLTPNTTYGFKITARNGDGVSGNAAGPFIRATLMEGATAINFVEISSTSIKVKAIGTFTNQTEGESGIRFYETRTSTHSAWLEVNDYWILNNLTPNTSYQFYVRSRNREGTVGPISAVTVRYTRAAVPSTPTVVSGWNQTDGNYIDVTINDPVNPAGTQYIVEVSTVSDFSVIISTSLIADSSLRISLLEAGKIYYVRTKAMNGEGYLTGYSSTGSAKTPPAAPEYIKIIDESENSITYEWSKVEDALSYNLYTSTGNYEGIDGNTWTVVDLTPNTSYWAYVRAVSLEGEGGGTEIVTGYTLMEIPEGVEFVKIWSSSMAVKAKGTFTNSDIGLSGVQIRCLTTGTTSEWLNTEGTWIIEGLDPNREYYFKARSRNIVGDESDWSLIEVSTYTLAEEPLAPAISEPTTYSLRVTINPGNNPDYTEYAIYCNELQKYVQSDGSLGDEIVWQPYRDVLSNDWGGSKGIEVVGLSKDNSYTFKVKARNVGGRETGWSPDSEPGITSPYAVVVKCLGLNEGEWTNIKYISFTVTGSDHYHYRFNQNSADTALTTDPEWDGSTMTFTMTKQGDWYLHVRGENASDGLMGQETFGPIRFDNEPPEILKIRCWYDVSMETEIISGEWTGHSDPYFEWDNPASTAPVEGYSIVFSTDSQIEPDNVIDTNLLYFSTQVFRSGIYYFKIKAKDRAGNWGEVAEFVYKYAQPGESPEVKEVGFVTGEEQEGEVVGVSVYEEPAILFNRDIDSSTIEGKVILRAVMNNLGEKGLWEVSGKVRYDSQTKQVIFTPQGELLKNYTYELVIMKGIRDVLGNEISTTTIKRFRTIMDPSEDNVIVGSDGKTKVYIEAGTLKRSAYIMIKTSTIVPAGYEEAKLKIDDKFKYPLEGSLREIVLKDENGQLLSESFSLPVRIEIPYSDKDRDGIIDGSSPKVKVETLKMYRLDEVNNEFEELDSEIDEMRQVVRSWVTHFSYYVLMGASDLDLRYVIAYPVPWRPKDSKIVFGNPDINKGLPSSCKIRIYTITGKKVIELEENDGDGKYEWNVKNAQGEDVAPGVYIYVIDTGNNKKTGKIVIIR